MINVELQFFLFVTLLFYIQKNATLKARCQISIYISIVSIFLHLLFGSSLILFNTVICRLWQFFFGVLVVYTIEFSKIEKYNEIAAEQNCFKLNDNTNKESNKKLDLTKQPKQQEK